MSEIAKRLKELRKRLGLTQEEFGKKLGLKKSNVSDIERGKVRPKDSLLRLIEQTFSVNPEWLRHGRGEMFLEKKPEPSDALSELFTAMEKLEGKVPRAVKRALMRAFETKDIEGFAGIMADYLRDIAEEAKAGTLKIQGNVAIGDSNVQVYKEGEK
jgi:transcriptional regulator with XRE-family HTH domain